MTHELMPSIGMARHLADKFFEDGLTAADVRTPEYPIARCNVCNTDYPVYYYDPPGVMICGRCRELVAKEVEARYEKEENQP